MNKTIPFLLALLLALNLLPLANASNQPNTIITQFLDEWEPFTQKGNYVQFGHYEQDNNSTNGQEPITWIVLEYDQKTQEAMLISKYCLDAHEYDSNQLLPKWSQCEIRQWLNHTFINDAFSMEEQARIAVSRVRTEDKFIGDERSYVITDDFVYLLSDVEVGQYFFPDGEDSSPEVNGSIAEPTQYLVARGVQRIEEYSSCWWWLRSSSSEFDDYAGIVDFDGYVFYCDSFCNGAIRPVIRIKEKPCNND